MLYFETVFPLKRNILRNIYCLKDISPLGKYSKKELSPYTKEDAVKSVTISHIQTMNKCPCKPLLKKLRLCTSNMLK